MVRSVLIVFATALALPAIGLAQTPPPTPPPAPTPPPPISQPSLRSPRVERPNTAAADQFHETVARREAGNIPERTARADRVAILVDAGQCAEAKRLALAEGDRDMADRVDEVCGPSRNPRGG